MTTVVNKKTTRAEFDEIIKKMEKERAKKTKGFDAKKWSGAIKAFDGLDPVELQRQWRDEWK